MLHALFHVAKIKNRDRQVYSHVPGKIFPDGPFHSSYELLTVCLKLNNHHALVTFTHTIIQSIKQTLPVIQMQVTGTFNRDYIYN